MLAGLGPVFHLVALEYFAGVGNVARAFAEAGYASYGFELKKNRVAMDILSPTGFAFAIKLAMQTCRGGFAWFAPVCSTWVWVSRYSTNRSAIYPMGNPGQPCVTDANVMISRVVLLVSIFLARGCWVVIEQPSSSLMQYLVIATVCYTMGSLG